MGIRRVKAMSGKGGVFYVVEKCNDCVCDQVCRYKEVYQNGVQSILDVIITADREGGFWKLRALTLKQS